MIDFPATPLRRDRKVMRWLLLGLLLLIGGAYVAAYIFTGDRIARGTTVGGVDVGGRTPAQALERLTSQLAPDLDRRITVKVGDKTFQRTAQQLGLAPDLSESIDQAPVGRSWEPKHLWEYLAGGSEHDLVVEVDQSRFDAAFEELAAEVDQPAKEGGVRFTARGTAEPVQPEQGRTVDPGEAQELLQAAYPLHTEQPVVLPVKTTEPTVSAAEVSRAMKEFANPAMSAPVVLLIAGERVTLQPKDYAQALSMTPVSGRLEPKLDGEALIAAVEPAMQTIALAPKDASVKIVDGKPQVVPGKDGVTFDPAEVTGAFLALVVGQGPAREKEIASQIATPELTAEEVGALGIKEVVSEFTTHYPHSDYRNINIGRAAELIDGTVLQPGETFSMNDTVGERTAENGFTEGFIISDGILVKELGGGVSQVATTLFNAAFFAGLEDVEHKPHSFYISRYPVGREATVAWPTVDLKFTNDTPYGILIQAWRDPSTPSRQGAMNVRMWSTKVWDIKAGQSDRYNFTTEKVRHLSGPRCEPNDGYGGFDIDVYRYFYKAGSSKLHHKETMHTHYTPSDTVICDG